jgi:hypothetical protein
MLSMKEPLGSGCGIALNVTMLSGIVNQLRLIAAASEGTYSP